MHLQHYILGGLAFAAACLRSQSAPVQTALTKPGPDHQTTPNGALKALPVSSSGIAWQDLQTPPESLQHLRQTRQERQLQQENHDSSETFDGFHIFNERSVNSNQTTPPSPTPESHLKVSLASSASMFVTGLVCGTILGASLFKIRQACQKRQETEEEPPVIEHHLISEPHCTSYVSPIHHAVPITEAIAKKYAQDMAFQDKQRLLKEQQVKQAVDEAITEMIQEEPTVVVIDDRATQASRQHLRSETSDYESLPPNPSDVKLTQLEQDQYVDVRHPSESEEIVVAYDIVSEPPPLPLGRESSLRGASKKASERPYLESVTLRRHATLPPPPPPVNRESVGYLAMHAVENGDTEPSQNLYDVIPREPVVRLQSI